MNRTRLTLIVAGLGLALAVYQAWMVREFGFVVYLSLVSLVIVALAATAVAFRRR